MKSAVMVFCPEISWGPVQPLIIFLERVGDSGKVFADFYQKRWVYMGVCGGGVGKSADPITKFTQLSNSLVVGLLSPLPQSVNTSKMDPITKFTQLSNSLVVGPLSPLPQSVNTSKMDPITKFTQLSNSLVIQKKLVDFL